MEKIEPTIKTVSLVSQIQGEFSALACPLPAPETRTQFNFSQYVSRNLGGVLPRKKGLGVNNAWSYLYGALDIGFAFG